jgi:hypothetical protein
MRHWILANRSPHDALHERSERCQISSARQSSALGVTLNPQSFAIFRLVAARKLFDHFENTTRDKPTNRRVDGNDISDLEFVGQHRVARLSGDGR